MDEEPTHEVAKGGVIMKSRGVKRNRGCKTILFVLLAVVSIITAGIAMGCTTEPGYEIRYEYTVKSGDTLWTIGKANVGDNEDIRDWIRKVQEINGININKGPLHPGQTLVLYRY